MPSPTVGGSSQESGQAEGNHREKGTTVCALVCALEMEMTNRSVHGDSRVDHVNCDGSNNRKSSDSAEVSVSLSGKRTAFMEGDDLYRLRDRKLLVEDKKRLCALSLGAAVLGILLMIIHAEICRYDPDIPYAALIIINLISLSTGCLLALIIAFHYKDIRLFIIDHNQVDWRIAMTSHRILGITLELLVCVIHPVGSYSEIGGNANSSSASFCVSSEPSGVMKDIDLLLSVLMFLRLYLVHRAILLHSKVLLSASYRSIGSLNNINFTFRFVLKVLMNEYPARTLLVFILFFWLTASWMLTLCESHSSFSAQTEGPMTRPVTSAQRCGSSPSPSSQWAMGMWHHKPAVERLCVSLLVSWYGLGVACTAMLVAVVNKTLALNKGEKHVHFFMLDIQISKRIRHAAANVLRECWLLHRTNITKGNRGEHRRHQRGLLEAIRIFRHLRLKQRKLRDYVSEMVDLPKMQMIMCDLSANWNNSYRELEQRILSMEQKLDELSRCFQQTSELLFHVLRHRNPEIR
ncbi:intermediate conductance calcium-activated potassium channel protein 4 [Xyrichtys novacula]|uniref:Intermediate conductance calcium-activated potassium channel protein 4 n=1 Tax=Xyrichtys novacula TaxID=13765 RepID=A0AAV1FKY1_XYRNO|nr:intermediate conductance calcium-activated potassium channel protein 4 [Xyrichtys novacula]